MFSKKYDNQVLNKLKNENCNDASHENNKNPIDDKQLSSIQDY